MGYPAVKINPKNVDAKFLKPEVHTKQAREH